MSLSNTLRVRIYSPELLQRLALLVFSFLLLAMMLSGCGAKQEDAPREKQVRATKYFNVAPTENSFHMEFSAIMKAQQTSGLAFTAPGYVQDLPISRGQNVRKGQFIARLDNRDFQSSLASSRAQYQEAETEYIRAQNLFKQDAIARMTLEQRKAALDVAKAALDQTEKALGDTAIYAPFSGQISEILVEKHEQVQAFQPIVTLQNNDSIVATVDIPSTLLLYMNQLEPQDVSVRLESLPERTFPAKFLEASGIPDPGTQTYEARFTFDPPKGLIILPGMTGSLSANFKANETAVDANFARGVEIPVSSILTDGTQTFVWVIDKSASTVNKRSVKIEDGIGDKVRVLSGLKIGDTIAAAGVSYMYEGMPVRELKPSN